MRQIAVIALLLALSSAGAAAPTGPAAAPADPVCPPLLAREFPSLHDEPVSLCRFKGKVILIVNTASQCGYTPQYEGLEALYRRYKDRGLVVLGFPANDFGGQEPGSSKDIARFCEINYGVSFPMFAKTSVVGADANPLYRDLATQSGQRPRWNFHKYLVNRDGAVVASFESQVPPRDARITTQIERLLAGRQ
ncbi:MAG TPA: glutathione peroxidase [Burkholderiales bacterium]|nr:glutathione peroxidase [Burkholderiales bacterium]